MFLLTYILSLLSKCQDYIPCLPKTKEHTGALVTPVVGAEVSALLPGVVEEEESANQENNCIYCSVLNSASSNIKHNLLT